MKKAGYFFFSFLPILASITLQFLVMIPLMGIIFIKVCHSASDFSDLTNQMLVMVSGKDFSTVLSVVYAFLAVIIFMIWYQGQFNGNFTRNVAKWIEPKLIIGVICIAPALQIATGIITTGVASLFPEWMERYTELMEAAGFSGNPSFLLVLYAVILGPIAEELTFRGVTLSSFKRALPFWAANLMQALLFGIFHMNMIQGVYAFCIGLVFGYVCERSGCIWYSIILHMSFNFMGTFSGMVITDTTSPTVICIIYLIYIFLGILGLWLIARNLPGKKKKLPYYTKESDSQTDIYNTNE